MDSYVGDHRNSSEVLLPELTPGAAVFLWLRGTGYETALSLRRKGLEHRDSLLVLDGTGTSTILFFRKPCEAGNTVRQVLTTGTGAINIGACKIKGFVPTPTTVRTYRRFDNKYKDLDSEGNTPVRVKPQRPEGRWPGNLILMHRPSCRALPADERGIQQVDCATDCVVPELERQSQEAGVLGSKTEDGHANDGAAARFYVQVFSDPELLEWLRKLAGPNT